MKFDKALNDYTSVFNGGRKAQLEMLLREIKAYNYTDFAQLVGAIHTHLDLINEKGEGSE